MSKMVHIPTVNFEVARRTLEIGIAANQSIMLLGSPGVGKSALVAAVAQALDLPLETLLGSTLDPTDIGGIPVVRPKGIERSPLAIIKRCVERPSLLFLDEASCAPPSVQAAELRLLHERIAGDVPLHPGTRVVLAANPPEQAPGGFELSSPFMGRVCALQLRPSIEEVCSYFEKLGTKDTALHNEALDFSLTARNVESKLLQIDIPTEAVAGNRPWGAPRAWERVVRMRAEAYERGMLGDNPVTDALTAGSVGEECANAYRSLLNLRKKLPTLEEILKKPKTVKLPEDTQLQLAALGLIGRIANQNVWAAWVYADRFRDEYKLAAMKMLLKRIEDDPLDMPFAEEGNIIRATMSAKVLKAIDKGNK